MQKNRWGAAAYWLRCLFSGRRYSFCMLVLWTALAATIGCQSRGAEPEPKPELETVGQALAASEWPTDGLVVTNSIQLDQRARVTGTVAAKNASTSALLAHSAELSLELDAVVSGSVRADTLYLGDRSNISANAQYNSKSGGGTITGTATTPLTVPLSITLPAVPTVNSGIQPISVASNATTTKAAGAYTTVTVAAGSGSGTVTRLILSGGTYHFASIAIGSDARLECSADCEVRVSGAVAVGARSFIGASGSGLLPSNMRLVVKGANGATGPNGLPAAFGLDVDTRLDAYTYVPNGTIRLGQRGIAKGKVIAKDVYFGTDSSHALFDPPVITQHPASMTKTVGQSATFSVVATGTGLTYQWQKDGVNIAGATSASVTVTASTANNGAQYRAVVSNAAGSATSNSAVLTVSSCTASDAVCNGLDDDCDGSIDEDYVATCGQGASSPRQICSGGTVVSVACNDSNACNGTESCSAGACVAGTAPVVDDGNPCTADSCSPAGGVAHTPVASGTSCTDGNACNGNETCNASGSCLAGTAPVVDDGNPCTADSCSPASGVAHTPVSPGTSCLDSNACNGSETCDANGACMAGTAPVVDDGNPCTADSCDAASGVAHTPVSSGTSCSDSNACNGSESCNASGSCMAGTAPVIDDGNPCTADSCSPASGVAHTPVAPGTSCTDSNACNGSEACNASGSCLAGTAPVVDDGNPCTADSCDAASGGVVHQPVPAGTTCGDGQLCNGTESCDASGTCQPGIPLPDDGNGGCCDPDADVYSWETLEIDPTIVTTYASRALPLFLGDERSQTPLDEEAIDTERVSIARGRVLDESGAPLACAVVGTLHQDELGSVRTLADGSFALAVNGGDALTLQFSYPGYATSYRAVPTQPSTDAFVPDVRLMAYGAAHPVSAGATTTTVVAGEAETDQDGTRSATMLVPPGTSAMVAGEASPRQNYAIRVKEVTNRAEVGHDGMQATLPPQSMFTYAVSFDVEGAEGKDVVLSQPIPVYVENFIGFPIGETAPVGRYDVAEERWVAEESGRVIMIVGQDLAGRATLDIDASPGADDVSALAISDAERATLGQKYPVGISLWRFRVNHFSPWDVNWGGGPDPDDPKPTPPDPDDNDDDNGDDDDDSDEDSEGPGPDGPNTCKAEGSIIECERQVLMEEVVVHGASFGLRYSSARQPGYGRQLSIPLVGATVPERLTKVELRVQVAGREFSASYTPAPNLAHVFSWDGRDRVGRLLNGRQRVGAAIGYTYPIVYQQTDRFGYNGNGTPITGSRDRGEVTIWKNWVGEIGAVNAQYAGLGGWTVDVHHMLDPDTGRVYLGNGGGIEVPDEYSELVTVAGTGSAGFTGDGEPATQAQINLNGNAVNSNLVVSADGTIYFSDSANDRVRRIGPDGVINTIAGGGEALGDGGLATLAKLDEPSAIAMGSDGNLYVADSLQHRIRKIALETGEISTVAGTGEASFSGDLGDPAYATLNKPTGITIAADGTMFIADSFNNRIRRIRDGVITTVAEGLNYPTGVAVAADGSVYISNYSANQIAKLSTSGEVTVAVGTGSSDGTPPYGDGGPALNAQVLHPDGVAIGSDGLLYFVDTEHHLVRRVNAQGNVESLVGTGIAGYSGDSLPASRSRLFRPRGFTIAPDGSIFVVDSDNQRIRRVAPSSRLMSSSGGLFVPLKGGGQLAEFDDDGRHLRTLDAYTGATLYTFGYDPAGWLTSVTDVDGRVTSIERDGTGRATAIVSPDGHTTALAIAFGEDGYTLSELVRPDGGRHVFTYDNGGLLSTMRDPKLEAEGGASFSFEFTNGRLTRDTDPLGNAQALSNTFAAGGRVVTRSTPLGRSYTYTVTSDDQSYQRVIGRPDGTQNITDIRTDLKPSYLAPNGTNYDERVRLPNGSTAYYLMAPAPVWGLNAPVTAESLLVMPSGLMRRQQSTHALSLDLVTGSLATETRTSTINGRTSTLTWNGATRMFTAVSAGSRQRFTVLNEQGRVAQTGAPGIETTFLDYNADGRLEAVLRGTRSTTFEYDTSVGPTRGALARATDALGRTVEFASDALGRITSVTAPDDTVIGFDWDTNSNLTGVEPPGRPLHAQGFDALNQQTSYVPPAIAGLPSIQTLYTFDADRNPKSILRPDGVAIGYQYDSAGRLDALETPEGLVDYAYYPATPPADGAPAALQSITAPGGVTLAYKYDGPLVKAETYSGTSLLTTTLSRTFDTDLRVATEAISAPAGIGTVTFGYDADSLQTCAAVGACSSFNSNAFTVTYDPQIPRPSGDSIGLLPSTYGYNAFGELTSMDVASGHFVELLEPDNLVRDQLGRIVATRTTNGGAPKLTEYGYDLQGRLETVEENGAVVEMYTYDDNGNRLSVTTPSGTKSATYDAQDRLLTYGTFAYTYAANGDLATKHNNATGESWQYTYDARGNLVKVILPSGTVIDYLVDGRNRRVGKRVNGTLVRQWVWSNQLRIAAELNGSGQVQSRFLYGNKPTTPEVVIRSNGTFRVASDHLGSVRALVNVDNPGQVLSRLNYTAFGEASGSGIGTIPQGFAGGLYDADTGLVRFGARDYDPVVGRWVSKDPILFDGGQGNLYVYVGNDSVNRRDPRGLWDLFVGYEVDLVGATGYEFGAGIVIDLDSPSESGFYYNFGPGGGANVGWGVCGGLVARDIEGWGTDIDWNAGDVSPVAIFDDKGLNGFAVGFGPGNGLSFSATETTTFTFSEIAGSF